MKPARSLLLASCLMMAACSPSGPVEPKPVPITETEATAKITLRYCLTESLDGKVRVFAAERGDETWLYEMRLEDGVWSSPERMDVPGRRLVQGPSFSREDGALFFASDAELEAMPGRKDLNIWRMPLEDGVWGEPQPLAGDINTGANETMAVVDRDGDMVFVSNHSRLGGGGYDLGEAKRDETGAWMLVRPLSELNDARTNDHIAITDDGRHLFFYSHRQPKLGIVDTWISLRQADGSWGEPVNPGEPLNSAVADFGAGLSGDGETFFFSRGGKLMQIPLRAILR